MRKLVVALTIALTLPWAAPAARAQSMLEAVRDQGDVLEGGVPVDRQTVRVSIDRQYAETTIEQQYVNPTQDRLEGRYVLTLGEGARVHGFAYWNGEEKIVGEVFEKEVARDVYEEVIGLRRDPALLEQVGEGAFAFRVYPIEAGERKRIEVRYGRRLARHGDWVEYRVPLGGKSSVFVDITDPRATGQVRSATHKVDARRDGDVIKVDVDATGDQDLVLEYQIAEKDWQVDATLHRDKGQDGYLVITLAAPDALSQADVSPKDVTIVIDHSGSMSGEPLEQARQAAAAVVRRLRSSDRVNVIQFDDGSDQLYGEPRFADDGVRADALAYINRIRDGGGTNIAGALERAFKSQHADEQPDVILFMTDGQSDAQEAVKAARNDRHDARVFTIGLGSGVEKPLLSRVAAEKRGRFTYIADAGAIEASVTHLFEQIESPVLLDVSVELSGARLERVYPRTIPDLTRGDELVIYGRVTDMDGHDGNATVTLRGRAGGQDVAYTASLVIPPAVAHAWVGRGWAEARVDDLLEQIALEGETDELENEAIELALAYNLVTPYTSFLAIPESELTHETRDAVASARERKKQIQAAHQDAVALSRDDMPPGDPLLEVRAPADAQQVTAYFPFGLVQDLTWDPMAETWRTRFLVPKDTADGSYEAQIVIVRADGTIEMGVARYTIDSAAPDFDVDVEETATGVVVRVTPTDPASRITVAVVGDPRARAELKDRGDGTYEGVLSTKRGKSELRIVVADKARNEAEMVVGVER